MYKNIIFDLGGVMVDFDPKTYLVDRFCNAEVEEQVSQLTFESEEWKLLDAGLITRSEANLRMLARAKEYGRAFEVQGVLDDWMQRACGGRRISLFQKSKSYLRFFGAEPLFLCSASASNAAAAALSALAASAAPSAKAAASSTSSASRSFMLSVSCAFSRRWSTRPV